MLAPTLAPPLAARARLAGDDVGGAAGKLARANSIRNPARTASTASALMIGLALVTLVAVLAAGLRSRFEGAVNELFVADYALTASDNFTPIDVSSANALRGFPGSWPSPASAPATARRSVRDRRHGVEPERQPGDRRCTWKQGSPRLAGQLGSDGAFVEQAYANANHLPSARRCPCRRRAGHAAGSCCAAIYLAAEGRRAVRGRDDLAARFDSVYPNPQNLSRSSTSPAASRRRTPHKLNACSDRFPDAKIQTKTQFKHKPGAGPDTLLEPALRRCCRCRSSSACSGSSTRSC